MGHATEDLLTNARHADSVLACSRCDGPVSERDLADGIAVRIDSQPVCQLCIETLPPGLRVQINRARALKGLAVTTYRVQHPTVRQASLFSFTNAGLLMMHRRAVLSGTEFVTPALPTEKSSDGSFSATNNSTPQQRNSPANHQRLMLMLAATGIVVIGGIIGLVVASSPTAKPSPPPSNAHPSTQPALQNQPTIEQVSTPRLVSPEALPTTVPGTEQATEHHPLTWSQYLTGRTPLEALSAAEHDEASADICERLTNEVIRERTTELTAAVGFLQKQNFDKVSKLLEHTKIPADRPEFADLVAFESTVRNKLDFQRKSMAEVVAPSPIAPPQLPNQQPIQPPVQPPQPPVVPPAIIAEPLTPIDDTQPVTTRPTKPAKAKVELTSWSGPLLLKETSFCTLDSADNIPAPWPTLAGSTDLQFIKSVALPGGGKKRLHQLVLGISSAQVLDGGIAFTLNSNYNRKGKTLRVFCDDQPLQDVVFNELGWRLVTIPLPLGATSQIRLRLEDTEELSATVPFWVGPLTLVKGAAPSAENAQCLPPTLATGDVTLSLPTRRFYQTLLQTLADNRGSARSWNDPKIIAFKEAKVLLTDFNEKARAALSIPLLHRWTHLDNPVPNAIESWNFEAPKPFADLKVAPSKNQTFMVMIPNGNESTLGAQEWEKRVFSLSTQLLNPPKGQNACIPIWVMGSLDGLHPVDPAVWSKVTVENKRWIIIDLTVAGPLAATQGQEMIADALKTLAYQLRQTQSRTALQ